MHLLRHRSPTATACYYLWVAAEQHACVTPPALPLQCTRLPLLSCFHHSLRPLCALYPLPSIPTASPQLAELRYARLHRAAASLAGLTIPDKHVRAALQVFLRAAEATAFDPDSDAPAAATMPLGGCLQSLQRAILSYLHRYWVPQYIIAFFVRRRNKHGAQVFIRRRHSSARVLSGLRGTATALPALRDSSTDAAEGSDSDDSFAALDSDDGSGDSIDGDNDDDATSSNGDGAEQAEGAAGAVPLPGLGQLSLESAAGSLPQRPATQHGTRRRQKKKRRHGLRAASASAVRMSSARFRRHQRRVPKSASGSHGPMLSLAAAPGGTTPLSPLRRRPKARSVNAAPSGLSQELGGPAGEAGEAGHAGEPDILTPASRLASALPRLWTAAPGKGRSRPTVPPGELNAAKTSIMPGMGASPQDADALEEIHATLWPMWSTPPLACLDLLSVSDTLDEDSSSRRDARLRTAKRDARRAMRYGTADDKARVAEAATAACDRALRPGRRHSAPFVLAHRRRSLTAAEEAEIVQLQDALLLDDLAGSPFEGSLRHQASLGAVGEAADPAAVSLVSMLKAVLAALGHEPMTPEQRKSAWLALLRTYLLPTAEVGKWGDGEGEGRV